MLVSEVAKSSRAGLPCRPHSFIHSFAKTTIPHYSQQNINVQNSPHFHHYPFVKNQTSFMPKVLGQVQIIMRLYHVPF